jgi:hypothetical protein
MVRALRLKLHEALDEPERGRAPDVRDGGAEADRPQLGWRGDDGSSRR